MRYVDQNFLKVFQLAQLIIEYLLHSQDYLADTNRSLTDENSALKHQFDAICSTCDKQTVELAALKKETRAMRKTLYAYQLMTKVPGGSGGRGGVVACYHRCEVCPKSFTSQYYLEAHLKRRHPEYVDLPNRHPIPTAAPAAAPKPEPPKPATPPPPPPAPDMTVMADALDRFTQRLMESEKQIRAEMDEKMRKEVETKQKSIDEAYRQKKLRYEKEIQDMKTALHQELDEERKTLEEERKEIEALLEKARKTAPRFGNLEDESPP
ncbi:Zinc finger protein dzip1, partial [Rhizophlyctis rosea]